MTHLICRACRSTYALADPRWQCACGGLLDLHFSAAFNPKALADRPHTLWRYREALPIASDDHITTLGEGLTPLTPIQIDGKPLFVKQDHLFPTGSYKDRGAALLISHARSLGITRLVEDSSGNAGAAVAAYAAAANIACDIYVPESTSPAKLAQIQLYGATLHRVPGTREDTARAVQEAARDHFYASHVYHPLFFHGTKTCAYEIWEQLGFCAPDVLFIPTGNGTLLIGAYIGFSDLLQQGIIAAMPRLIAVQATRCAPIARQRDSAFQPEAGETIAEGIAIAQPARAEHIREAIRNTGGSVYTVTDDETVAALKQMAEMGFYIEPTSATAIAAFKKYPATSGETVVIPLTGHGLKSTEKLLKLLAPHPGV